MAAREDFFEIGGPANTKGAKESLSAMLEGKTKVDAQTGEITGNEKPAKK
jgi:hypothetical protein